MAVPAPSAAPRIVGRVHELATLSAALEEGAGGTARAVIVRGEAGIGKTRLIDEAMRVAARAERDPRMVVATGQCVDLGPIGAPFTPIRRLLRDLVSELGRDAVTAAAGGPATAEILAALAPELAHDGAPQPEGGASQVAEAIERVLEQLSREHHIVLVIEDLHWADTATIALLTTLALTARATHLTLVMSYRTDDVGRGHPLRGVLAELDRARSVLTIDVPRLASDAVADQVAQLTGTTTSFDELERIVMRSEGVPFFVEELVRLPHGVLPHTLRDVILARFDGLTSDARAAVKLASVAGFRIDAAALASLWNGTEPALLEAMREAIAASIVVTDQDGYAFRHALIQEAVYEELLPSERTAAHAALAALLQTRVDEGDTTAASAAAEHWIAARDDEHAFDASSIARDQARREHALGTCARLGERLLDLWPRVSDPDRRLGVSAADLRAQIARDYLEAGRNRDVYRVVDSSLAVLPPDAALERARLHAVSMLAANETHGCAFGVDHASAVDTLLAEATDPAALSLRARALAMRALLADDEPTRMRRMDEALRLAQDADDPDAWSYVLRRQSSVLTLEGRYDDGLAAATRARQIAGPDSPSGLRTATNITDVHLIRGAFRDAIAVAEEGIESAVAAGLERSAGAFLHVNLAEALLAVGESERGIDHARRAMALTRGQAPRWLACATSLEATARLWDGDIASYEALCADIEPVRATLDASVEDRNWWHALRIDRALIESARARPADRRRALADALTYADMLHEPTVEHQFEHCRELSMAAARALGALASAGGAADAELARRIVAIATHGPGEIREPYLAVITAHIATARQDPDALERWRSAVAVAEDRIACRHLLDARYRLALAELEHGHRAAAVATLRSVVVDASACGVGIVAQWARDALARHGEDRGDGPLSALTAREVEVLALIADGLTNREIGERLFISPKTASVHVSAILAKIGAVNRTEAASVYANAIPAADDRGAVDS